MYAYLLGLLLFGGGILTSYAEAQPNRLVSVGGSITEWIVALDGESKLVGVDTTSLHPDSVTKLPKIGYQRQLSAEGIASLKPDILLGSLEMGPDHVLQQISNLGIEVKVLSIEPSLQAVEQNILTLGKLLNEEAKAQHLFNNYQQRLNNLQLLVKQAQKQQQVPTVLLLIGQTGGNSLVAGKGTSADWLISQAGGNNLASFTGYKAISSEAIVALDPDILIVANRGNDTEEELLTNLLKAIPALNVTKAIKQNRVITIDASLLVAGLGPRVPTSIEQLIKVFYTIPTPEQGMVQ